ncbi:MAG TPA: helix-turn-helix domain-containing protein [Acidimicrobiales bacterium]|jgi:DNA-binding HxlR family transcriptional regulator|nr:helix-turn-helix domain-containing protein [Acidimicrobiales bacterium]
MLKREYEGQNCSIASALEIVGERWTLLIIRDVFLGLHRFDEFQESLGIARNVLADRLDKLVEAGILEKTPYGDRGDRFDYHLTKKGLDLHVTLSGLRQWGDKYLCDKPPTVARRKTDNKRLVAALVPVGTKTVPIHEAEFVAGPGRDPAAATWRVLADKE